MATRRYSIDPNGSENDITEAAGSAVATKNIELTVNTATTIVTDGNVSGGTRAVSKNEVLVALEKLSNYILKNQWPPS